MWNIENNEKRRREKSLLDIHILYHTYITNTLTRIRVRFLRKLAKVDGRESFGPAQTHTDNSRMLCEEKRKHVCALCEPVATRFGLGKGLRNPVERALPSHRKREWRPAR